MRESRPYGSVRRTLSNGRPYRYSRFCCNAFGRSWHIADLKRCPLSYRLLGLTPTCGKRPENEAKCPEADLTAHPFKTSI
jgi:hypothetical protein